MPSIIEHLPFTRTQPRMRRIEWLTIATLQVLDRIACRRWLMVFGIGIGVIVLRVLLLPWMGFPHPWVDDEFSYLLGGDTFASGRLANPTHPLWRFFETLHVIWQPNYASKYQPGQAAFLALGQVLFGHPYWGVVLSTALFCAAVCWMLQILVSPGWALIGGVLTWAVFGTDHYWMQSYWGGSVAAFGGCLVIGSALRLVRKPRPERYTVPFALGIAVLFVTRPFEGAALVFGVGLAIAAPLWHQRKELPLFRMAVPCAAILACMAAFQLYYDRQVTGSPLLLPYTLHERTYATVPTFWFQPLNTSVRPSSDPVIYSAHWKSEMYWYLEDRAVPGWHRFTAALARVLAFIPQIFGPLANVLWLIPLFWPDSRIRQLTLMAVPVIAASGLVVWQNLHYIAPAIPAVIAIVVVAIQRLRILRLPGGRRIGTLAVALAMAVLLLTIYQRRPFLHAVPRGLTFWGTSDDTVVNKIQQAAKDRDDIIARFSRTGTKHLIIVRYTPNHTPYPDWVHNTANLDAQAVIWARDRGQKENQRLIDYYRNRRIWLMQASDTSYSLAPY